MVNHIDGVKIHLQDGEWVHAAPDPDMPYFQIIAEGRSPERASELIAIYRSQLEKLVPPGT
jgi:phosphomannomutase